MCQHIDSNGNKVWKQLKPLLDWCPFCGTIREWKGVDFYRCPPKEIYKYTLTHKERLRRKKYPFQGLCLDPEDVAVLKEDRKHRKKKPKKKRVNIFDSSFWC